MILVWLWAICFLGFEQVGNRHRTASVHGRRSVVLGPSRVYKVQKIHRWPSSSIRIPVLAPTVVSSLLFICFTFRKQMRLKTKHAREQKTPHPTPTPPPHPQKTKKGKPSAEEVRQIRNNN